MFLIYWDNTLVGMTSVLPMPCGTIKYAYRQHRLVILPDFQGLGIGTKVNDFLAKYYVDKGLKYFIRTTHIRLNNHLSNSPYWKATNNNNKIRSQKDVESNYSDNNKLSMGDTRQAGSYEYLGVNYANKLEKVIKYNGENINDFKRYINTLKDKYYIRVVTGKPKEENNVEKAMKELGVRTEMAYFNKNGLVENSKYKNILEWSPTTLPTIILRIINIEDK